MYTTYSIARPESESDNCESPCYYSCIAVLQTMRANADNTQKRRSLVSNVQNHKTSNHKTVNTVPLPKGRTASGIEGEVSGPV